MGVPDAQFSRVPPEKLLNYLLDEGHAVGGSKAEWFTSLGYSLHHPRRLAEDLLRVVREATEYDTHPSAFGVKYVVVGRITTPCGREVSVLTVWIRTVKERGPRLVTARPAKERYDEGA